MGYAENAKKYKQEMVLLKAEIDAYEAAHKRDGEKSIRNALIPLKRKLIKLELKLSDDYNAMYHKHGVNTYDDLTELQGTMRKDITSFQDDLMGMRKDYIEWHKGMMEEKYPEPLDYKTNIEKVKETANYQYLLFQNIREILVLQNKKLSYCKSMDQYEVRNAEKFQDKLRDKYSEDFNALFNLTVSGMKEVGLPEAKRLLEVRGNLIKQGQEDYSKKGGRLIVEKPSELRKICDKGNRVTSYKKKLNTEIETYTFIIEADKEIRQAEKEYHESGQYDADVLRAEQEEEARYDPDWVIPDEEYKTEEGNIIRDDDDDRGI